MAHFIKSEAGCDDAELTIVKVLGERKWYSNALLREEPYLVQYECDGLVSLFDLDGDFVDLGVQGEWEECVLAELDKEIVDAVWDCWDTATAELVECDGSTSA